MKKFYLLIPVSLFVIISIFSECKSGKESDAPIRIAISKATPENVYHNYIRWLKAADSTIQYFDLYHLKIDSAMKLLATCDGLLLTGGTDIYPGKYGKESDTARCWEPDLKRDSLEILSVAKALETGLPILGVCRGHQLLNVYFGGSLIIDIPTDLDTMIKHMQPNTYGTYHEIQIKKGTLLYDIVGKTSGVVNSNHHQGIDVLATPLESAAYTEDYLIESVCLKYYEDEPFLLGVQWHPERMDYGSPLSINIVKSFLEACRE